MKDDCEKNRIQNILRVLSYLCDALILGIALLACCPKGNTQQTENFFQKCSSIILENSSTFFMAILYLCLLSFVLLAISFLIGKRYIENQFDDYQKHFETNRASMEKRLSDDEARFYTVHNQSVNSINELTLNIVHMNDKAGAAFIQVKATYSENLSKYHQSNKEIYRILKHTQLYGMEKIETLIDTYLKF